MKIGEFYNKLNPAVSASRIIFKNIQAKVPSKKVKEIAETTNGGTPLKNRPEFWGGDIPWLNSGHLKDGIIGNYSDTITELGLKKSSAKKFPEGTLVVAMYGATVGKVGILDFESTTNQAVCAVFPDENAVSRDFLYWFFRQKRFDFLNESFGGAQPNISQKVIKQTEIPIPDKKTQEEIVDYLNQIQQNNKASFLQSYPEINGLVNKFLSNRKAYDDILNSTTLQFQYVAKLRQSILQEAIQGKLTEEWRKTNPDAEPADQLLARIQKEKERLIREKQIKKEKPLPPVSEEEKPFILPERWVWCRLGDISNIVGGGTPSSTNPDYFADPGTGVPWVTPADLGRLDQHYISNGRRDISELGLRNSSARLLPEGTVLFSSRAPIGYVAISKNPISTNQGFQSCVPHFNLMNQYIYLFLKYISKEINQNASGTTFKEVSGKYLSGVVIPVPPLGEQKQIATKTNQLMTYCDELEGQVNQSQANAEQLMEAVLGEVFEGEEPKIDQPLIG